MSNKKKKTWKAPTRSADGSLLRHARVQEELIMCFVSVDWVPADHVWFLALEVVRCEKARGHYARFICKDTEGREWPMSIPNFLEMLKKTSISRGWVEGEFGVSKRGEYYSLKYIGPSCWE